MIKKIIMLFCLVAYFENVQTGVFEESASVMRDNIDDDSDEGFEDAQDFPADASPDLKAYIQNVKKEENNLSFNEMINRCEAEYPLKDDNTGCSEKLDVIRLQLRTKIINCHRQIYVHPKKEFTFRDELFHLKKNYDAIQEKRIACTKIKEEFKLSRTRSSKSNSDSSENMPARFARSDNNLDDSDDEYESMASKNKKRLLSKTCGSHNNPGGFFGWGN